MGPQDGDPSSGRPVHELRPEPTVGVGQAGERTQSLLDAILTVGSDLDLPTVLERIVATATELVDARYGALAVLGDSGTLSQFITVGLDADHRALIGAHPDRRGVLGLLTSESMPMRIAEVARHPLSAGFPPHHPTMSSFLGVPIAVRGEVIGHLYLADKSQSRLFDADDERFLVALAAAAGVAIENARLYDEAKKRERWLRASAEVTTMLLSGTDPSDALLVVARRARELTDADVALIALPGREDRLVVEIADGRDQGELIGVELSTGGWLLTGSFPTEEAIEVIELRPDDPSAARLGPDRFGTITLVPLGEAAAFAGLLGVVLPPGATPFGMSSTAMLQTFANQAAVALQLAKARRDGERVALYEDRDRIARDLHDLVIQRLFASGMRLQSSVPLIASDEALSRVHEVVAELDTTIREIRTAIYALQSTPASDPGATRSRILEVTRGAAQILGFEPSLRFDGPIDIGVPAQIGDQMVAVLVEAMSNVVRHAHARHVSIAVEVRNGSASVAVHDDGVGLVDAGRRSGLADLATRAAILDGSFRVSRSSWSGGTELLWTVPLPPR